MIDFDDRLFLAIAGWTSVATDSPRVIAINRPAAGGIGAVGEPFGGSAAAAVCTAAALCSLGRLRRFRIRFQSVHFSHKLVPDRDHLRIGRT